MAGRVELLRSAPLLLAEGSVVERVRRAAPALLHPELLIATLARERRGRALLETIWRGYLHVARDHGLPIVLLTPTWRADGERVARAGLDLAALMRENVSILQGLREEHLAHGGPGVLVGGLLGPGGDAYDPRAALSSEEAVRFHRPQAEALAAAGVDFLTAQTLPALSEATGLARAMAGTRLPFLASFVVRPEGTLLDGTRLADAIQAIDGAADPAPLAYTINCVHPRPCRQALTALRAENPAAPARILGLQANGAALAPEALDGATELISDDPAPWGAAMVELRREFGLRLLGGCCGTDERHIAAIAAIAAIAGKAAG